MTALDYKSVRGAIHQGDILMFQGRGPLSRLIRWGSESRYSHCGIASWENGRLMVFHAMARGVRHVAASKCVRRYNGRVDWWTLTPGVALARDGVVEHARRHVGKPFAVAGMIRLAWLISRGSYRNSADSNDDPPAMFCSWYVSHCYREGGGVDLDPTTADDCTSPGMLERSPLLQRKGTLHK